MVGVAAPHRGVTAGGAAVPVAVQHALAHRLGGPVAAAVMAAGGAGGRVGQDPFPHLGAGGEAAGDVGGHRAGTINMAGGIGQAEQGLGRHGEPDHRPAGRLGAVGAAGEQADRRVEPQHPHRSLVAGAALREGLVVDGGVGGGQVLGRPVQVHPAHPVAARLPLHAAFGALAFVAAADAVGVELADQPGGAAAEFGDAPPVGVRGQLGVDLGGDRVVAGLGFGDQLAHPGQADPAGQQQLPCDREAGQPVGEGGLGVPGADRGAQGGADLHDGVEAGRRRPVGVEDREGGPSACTAWAQPISFSAATSMSSASGVDRSPGSVTAAIAAASSAPVRSSNIRPE